MATLEAGKGKTCRALYNFWEVWVHFGNGYVGGQQSYSLKDH